MDLFLKRKSYVLSLMVSIVSPAIIYILNPKEFSLMKYIILFICLFIMFEMVLFVLMKFNTFNK